MSSEHIPNNESKFDVFLAHNNADADFVNVIANALRKVGIRPWVAKDQIPPGKPFQDYLQTGIKNAATVAIFIGKKGVGRWQAFELRAAISKCVEEGIPVIPVLLPDVDQLPEELLFLRELNWVQFGSGNDSRALRLLTWGILGTNDDFQASVHETLIDEMSAVASAQHNKLNVETPPSAQPSSDTSRLVDEAAASRAFLQRAEVRLSTLHRIAGVFLNGAGLLVLFPVLVTQVVSNLIQVVSHIPFQWSARINFLLIIVFVSLLPLYSLLLLFKELIQFYYVTRHDGRDETDARKFFPRFTFTGLALPPEETTDGKHSILVHQYSGRFTDFLVPRAARKRHYFTQVKSEFNAAFPPLDKRSMRSLDNMNVDVRVTNKEHEILDTALRMTGFDDRSLSEEVAKTEFSISRHIVYLRTLVIRYFKSLILLIVSTLVLAVAAGFAPKFIGYDTALSKPLYYPTDLGVPVYALSLSFLCWSAIVALAIRRPIEWIYELADPAKDVGGTHVFDPELVRFERVVQYVAGFVALLSILTILGQIFYDLENKVFDVWFTSASLALTVIWISGGLFLWKKTNDKYKSQIGR